LANPAADDIVAFSGGVCSLPVEAGDVAIASPHGFATVQANFELFKVDRIRGFRY